MNQMLLWIDYAGIVVFAITGCLVAARKHLDIISFILLAIVTGIGGGTLRDMILNRTVFWVSEPIYLTLCVVTGILMFFFAQRIHRYHQWIVWGDAIGIAVFSVAGTRIAYDAGASYIVCVFMGVMTSIVGGIIRDILAGEPSLIVRKEIYATACVLGSVTFLSLYDVVPEWSVLLGMAATFILRAAAIVWRMQLPGYRWIELHAAQRRSTDI
jgi:uncharacterized membrane protein YeiH